MKTLLSALRNRHFWYIALIFCVMGLVLYSPLLSFLDAPGVFLRAGFTSYAIQNILFLLPVMYANYIFKLKGGLASLVISGIFVLPKAIFMTVEPIASLLVSTGVTVTGSVITLSFYLYNRNIAQREYARNMLSRLIDALPVPIFSINRMHKVTQWNTALVSLTGIKREEMLGTDNHWKAFYTEKRPVMADLITDGASEEEIVANYPGISARSSLIKGAFEAENFFPELGPAGKWLYFSASPILDGRGDVVGAVETLADITDRKNAERALRESEKNLRYYLEQITRAQEEERKRVARELHDSTLQTLIAMLHQLEYMLDKTKMPIKEAKALRSFHEQLKDVVREVRRFSRDLRPSILDDLGLLAALEWITQELKNSHAIESSLTVSGDQRRLSPEAELLLFRIVQEALSNVAKHAEATSAEVLIDYTDGKVKVDITDNGKGFIVPEKPDDLLRIGKLGLAGLQERAKLLGGTLTLKSNLGQGTSVSVEVHA